jgi:hypothetical protein
MLEIRMTKTGEPYQGIARFGHLNFEFVSDFGFRISSFELCSA